MHKQSNGSGVEVRRARNGKGIFAKKKFKAGETIFHIKGKLFHYTILIERGGKFQDNTYRFAEETYLSPQGELGEFVNHSCEPNSKVVKKNNKLFLVAFKDIPKGKEITFDYSTVLAADDIWTMKCNCGAKTCRGIVRKYTRLPKKLLKDYIAEEIIPRYILAF